MKTTMISFILSCSTVWSCLVFAAPALNPLSPQQKNQQGNIFNPATQQQPFGQNSSQLPQMTVTTNPAQITTTDIFPLFNTLRLNITVTQPQPNNTKFTGTCTPPRNISINRTMQGATGAANIGFMPNINTCFFTETFTAPVLTTSDIHDACISNFNSNGVKSNANNTGTIQTRHLKLSVLTGNNLVVEKLINYSVTCPCDTRYKLVEAYPSMDRHVFAKPTLFIGSDIADTLGKPTGRYKANRELFFGEQAEHLPLRATLAGGSLPPGTSLSVDGAKIKLSGNATTEGDYTFTVRVSDSCQLGPKIEEKSIMVPVRLAQIVFTETQLPAGRVGVPYSFQVRTNADGSRFTPISFIALRLPPGLNISTTGLISGIPSAAGTYNNVVIQAQDTSGNGYTQLHSVNLNSTFMIQP